MSRLRAGHALALAVALTLSPTPALANGRFPASSAVVLVPDDPDFVLARVSFGLLVSRDRGKTWGWVCERSVGFSSSEDPTYVARADGSIAAGTFTGVRLSNDHGCSWTGTAGFEKEVVVDLAATDRTGFLALASAYDRQTDAGQSVFRTVVFETHDFGRTFAPLGPPLDASLLAYTVEIAPSDASRIYVSAAKRNSERDYAGYLFASSDHGKTFARHDLALVAGERSAWIAAVDPNDPRRLYVRTAGGPETPSRLFVSDDAGEHFRSILTAKGPLAGFALSPDGSKVWVGGALDGLLVASTRDFAFEKKSSVQVQCLTASRDEVWVCSNEMSGFFLATTSDGEHFDAKLHLQKLAGILACAADSTTARECPAEWPSIRRTIGIDDVAAAPAPPRPPPAHRGPWRIVLLLVAVGSTMFWLYRRRRR